MLSILYKTICLGFCLFSISALAESKLYQDKYCDLGIDCTFHPHDEIAVIGAIKKEKNENGKYDYDGQLKSGKYSCDIVQKNSDIETFLKISEKRHNFSGSNILYSNYLEKGESYKTNASFTIGGYHNRDHNYLAFFVFTPPGSLNCLIDPKIEVTVNCKKL